MQHNDDWAVFNPHNKPIGDLPIIFGFNNGSAFGYFPGLVHGLLLAEDGTRLGDHVCSEEAFIPHDLAVRKGSREFRHETFRKHYPDGYRMVFVSYGAVQSTPKLMTAIRAAAERDDAEAYAEAYGEHGHA